MESLEALLEAQPEDVSIDWTFTGTSYFISAEPHLAVYRELLIDLLASTKEADRDRLLIAVKTARAKLALIK